jgi:uncharacterized protein (DUF4415 family)
MSAKRAAGDSTWVDPDDAPELTDEFFRMATVHEGTKLIRRGRPRAASPKVQVTLRLDAGVLEKLRATGPGWQTRANAILKRAVTERPRRAR